MKSRLTFCAILILLSNTLIGSACAMDASPSCGKGSTVTTDFPIGKVLFPDRTNITDQFRSQGLIFSADDADLPPIFQKSLKDQEHIVISGTFHNLFKLKFVQDERPVTSVTVTLVDSNEILQTHTLTAFDSTGAVVDTASYVDKPGDDRVFSLTVSSCKGIAFVVAIEQPFGAEAIQRITYTRGPIEPGMTFKAQSELKLRASPPSQRFVFFVGEPGSEVRRLKHGERIEVQEVKEIAVPFGKDIWLKGKADNGQTGWVYYGDRDQSTNFKNSPKE